MIEIVPKFSFVKNFFKVVFLVALAGGAFAGNFLLEQRIGNDFVVNSGELAVFDYNKENILKEHGVIRFSNDDGVNNSMEIIDSKDGEYILKFNAGKFWGNFSVSNARVNFLVDDKVVIIPNGAVFSAEIDDGNLKIFTYSGDLYLGFLDSGVEIDKYEDKYSPAFMNRFVVPKDSRAVVTLSKIDQRLKGLLYSRLFTEFKRSTIPSDMKKVDFVLGNFKKDEAYLSNLEKEFFSDLRFQGNAVAEGALADVVFWMEENLTFVPEKKDQLVFKRLFSYLDQAFYYANKDDQFQMERFLEKFNFYRTSLDSEISFSDKYYVEIDKYMEDLAIFAPGSMQHDLYKKLLIQKFNEGRADIEIVEKLWLNVYRAMDDSPGMLRNAVTDYYEYLSAIMKDKEAFKNKNEFAYKIFISYQDQLFENLFLRYSNFYQTVYFDIKSLLEEEILSFYEQGQLKTELGQDFISRKIDFLRKLMNVFFDESVEVQAAKDIANNLIEGIYNLTPPESARTSVTDLFQSQLSNLADFWGYLDNVEYNVSKVYGASHKERYQTYLLERDRVWTFETMTDAVLGGGGSVSSGTMDKIKNDIVGRLMDDKNVSNLEVAEVKDPNARYVQVKYVLGGYPVEAIFDRDGKTVKDVYVYDELISHEAVKPSDLFVLIDEKLSEKYDLSGGEGAYGIEEAVKNNAERIAKLYLINKSKIAGFEVSEDNIKLVDEELLIYRIDKM
ncbi:MAG: hypothetical protein PHP74_04140, partial [Candidatus Gracilibacteria bacterium]|nr:hypothetical protein [Candidatus Gracilibacteria bacterium]